LGPGGWENSPYGSPVLHTLVRVPNHLPLLLDVPVLPHHSTLQSRRFSLSGLDWRGVSWSKRYDDGQRRRRRTVPYEITTWIPNKERRHIDVTVDIFLEFAEPTGEDTQQPPRIDFCPSPLYLLPSSFFLEPITMCARSLLDFFAL
jgi:hypothetical protein